jgi:hypothetical protein
MKRLALLFASCATLNTAGMSDSCRRLYDACLSACPGAAPGSPPITPGPNLQIEVAACTQACNDRAKQCQ